MFSIDGIQWNIPCGIKRTAEITASDISGLLLDKTYFNDVIGTFMKYNVSIAVPLNMRDQFTSIYEKITEPVGAHSFVLPYNNSTIALTGRVENISDVYVRMPNGVPYWKGIEFDIIANHPSKTMNLNQVITRGRAPLPEAANPSVGDTYTWNGSSWTVYSIPDADEISY